MRNKLVIYAALAAALLTAGFLGFRGFMRSHDTTWDENIYMMLGEKLHADPLSYSPSFMASSLMESGSSVPGYLYEPLFKHPPLFPYLIAAAYHFTNSAVLAAFYVSYISGIFIVLMAFLIGKEIFDARAGALAALVTAIDPIRLTCSVKMWADSTLAVLMLASLLLFIKAVKREKTLLYVSAGVFAGLAMLVKCSALLLFPIGLSMMFISGHWSTAKKGFLLWPAAAFLVFLPWLLLNYHVYGTGLISKAAYLHGIRPQFLYNAAAAVIVALPACLLARKLPGWARLCALAAALTWLLSRPYVFRAVAGTLDMSFVPSHGWLSGMFSYEPRLFYFRRLIELSPFYLISFLGILFMSKPRHDSAFLFVPVFWAIGFYIFWGSYQSRYLLFAAPLLLIMASYAFIFLRDSIRRMAVPRSIGTALKALLAAVIIISLVKTVYVDLGIALVNDLAYF